MLSTLQSLPEGSVYTKMASPVGELWLVGSAEGLHALFWRKEVENPKYKEILAQLKESPNHSVLKTAVRQLREYFAGKRTSFDVPLAVTGTPFQKKAWQQLRKIPYGKTISYRDQAQRLGDVKKARAVGTANSRNPISIIVPCHRVIASSGALSGFGGGPGIKKFLLELESTRS